MSRPAVLKDGRERTFTSDVQQDVKFSSPGALNHLQLVERELRDSVGLAWRNNGAEQKEGSAEWCAEPGRAVLLRQVERAIAACMDRKVLFVT